MFNAILIATDLSDTSEHASNVAAQLAREHGSALHLAHVIRDPATEPWALDAFGAISTRCSKKSARGRSRR